mmetsp:Transcript_105203/g.241120  ORF Transcript_105203/g.241120 Transcript_105203/m.241120 type:complete len:1428 (+) Transcript_105203:26-4309(+)
MSAALRKGKTVEETYKKLDQVEHILLRPDTYVGSVEPSTDTLWVWDTAQCRMAQRKIDWVPALFKIFDEILVNAADNFQRDHSMDTMKVDIDRTAGFIRVWNNGRGIPVQVHKEHGVYVPELIFGHLLTSDNYNDSEKKVTGGRNGYGAKLTNIFSTRFIVETADTESGSKFCQVFENNMQTKNPPKIQKHRGADYTSITFWPDFRKFGMMGFTTDMVDLMTKRVFDVAGSTDKRCKVHLNGSPLRIGDFGDYIDLYLAGRPDAVKIREKCNERWDICVSLSDGNFQQVSFVNSINTTKGGTHVNLIADQLIAAIAERVNKKNKGGMEIKPNHIRTHLWIFVNSLIENPAFDSQTKDTLTSKPARFGSTCELSEATIKKVMQSGIVDLVLNWAKAKEQIDMGKKLKSNTANVTRVLGIPKLEDANDAGGRYSSECTLILTEGDSAKSLAVAGLSVVGRDRYGVFPLRGKVLNVRDASMAQCTNNAEISNLIKIVGLDIKKQYTSTAGLRYGHIMVMTDQDLDGSHIKGLLVNLFHHWWPSLIKMDGFIREFVTPIVKLTKGGDTKTFFTMNEYEEWKRHNNIRGWQIKYYKGLGTSTTKEAKEYFSNLPQHELDFEWTGEGCGQAIDLAFNKKRADDRKEWINSYVEGTHIDHTEARITYRDFINKELVQFSRYDVVRSIPSVVDGFKPTQRKVLFAAFKRNLKSDVKVAQLVGYISEHTAYHHGETSLENTVVGMAQNFVGSNNINLLFPSGQFGTRLQGGKDSASSRYIYTRLAPLARACFHENDDALLAYQLDEGQSIEPTWYMPVLPMVLVNGADGIGTGWSTSVPNFNPREIVANLKRYMRGEQMLEMMPWYRGYKGSIVPNQKGQGFDVTGVVQAQEESQSLVITELPVRKWTQDYREFLMDNIAVEQKPQRKKKGKDEPEEDDSKPALFKEMREHHSHNSVHFELHLTPEQFAEACKDPEKMFKLRSSLGATNMVLFGPDGRIKKYDSALEILREFAELRLGFYDKRKSHLLKVLNEQKAVLDEKVRFILMVINDELIIAKKKRADLVRELKSLGFKTMGQILHKKDEDVTQPATQGDEEAPEKKSGYDYLLGMPLWNLTYEKVEELRKQAAQKAAELKQLQLTPIQELWDRDLDAVLEALQKQEETDTIEDAAVTKKGKAGSGSPKGKRGGAKAKAAPRAAKAPAQPKPAVVPTNNPTPSSSFNMWARDTASAASAAAHTSGPLGSGAPAPRPASAAPAPRPAPASAWPPPFGSAPAAPGTGLTFSTQTVSAGFAPKARALTRNNSADSGGGAGAKPSRALSRNNSADSEGVRSRKGRRAPNKPKMVDADSDDDVVVVTSQPQKRPAFTNENRPTNLGFGAPAQPVSAPIAAPSSGSVGQSLLERLKARQAERISQQSSVDVISFGLTGEREPKRFRLD